MFGKPTLIRRLGLKSLSNLLRGTSEFGNDLLGERFLHSLLVFNRYVAVHGDLERDIALLDDEANIRAHGKVIGIISGPADRRDDNRLHRGLFARLVCIQTLQHECDPFSALRGRADRIPSARFLVRTLVRAGTHRDAHGGAYLGLREKLSLIHI